jgi:hypothetical protein
VKKEEAVESIEQAGRTINDVNGQVWTMALNPTHYGWGKSIASIAAIPVLSAASVGQMVSEAVVRQISPNVFDQLSNFGQTKPKDDDSKKG